VINMATKNVSTKKKKKLWYGLYAPESLNNAFLGETTVYSPDEMIGKAISLNLSMFTGDMKKQNIIATFRVKEVKDNKGLTELLGFAMSPAHIKRLVRRKRDKIDDSFLAKSLDGKTLRIKTVAMTGSKTHESATSAIRLSFRAKIKKILKETNFSDFVNSLINGKYQKEWKSSLSKIYPVKFLEVRFIAIEEPKRALKDVEEIDFTDRVVSDEDDFSDDDALEKVEEDVDVEDVGDSSKKPKKSKAKKTEVVEELDDVDDVNVVEDIDDEDKE